MFHFFCLDLFVSVCGQMLARISIDGRTYLPLSYNHPLCSDTESWQFRHWKDWTVGMCKE
jgi:hypothetical protein